MLVITSTLTHKYCDGDWWQLDEVPIAVHFRPCQLPPVRRIERHHELDFNHIDAIVRLVEKRSNNYFPPKVR